MLAAVEQIALHCAKGVEGIMKTKKIWAALALCSTAFLALAAGVVINETSSNEPEETSWLSTLMPGDGLGNPGPGLGNLSYLSSEVWKPISWVNGDNGIPGTYPFRKAFGTNVGIMHNGYFLVMFAPDSGSGPGGFLLYDVSDPRNIRLVKKIYEPEGRTADFREAHAIGSSHFNGRKYIVIQTVKGLEFWDFTDVNNIAQTSKLALPGVNGGDYTDVAWQLWWQAPYVYVAASNQGMYIVDASNPAAPVIASRGNGRPNPVPPAELGGFRIGPIFTMGNQLVVTSMDQRDGFASLDISDPLNPVLLDKTPDLPATYYATCFDGAKVHASVRGGGARMVSYDLSDPKRFVLEQNHVVIDEQLYCATQDGFVFQGAQEHVHKVDVSSPFNYVLQGAGSLNVPHSDHGQVSPMGNLIFIGNDHGSGSAFMVHDPNPDLTPPKVRQVSPRHGAQRQALSSRIGVGMTDSIDLDSVNSSNFIVRPVGGSALEGTYSAQLGIVNFFPAAPLLPNTTYEVVVTAGGMKDYAGNPVAQGFASTFSTGPASDAALVFHWPLDNDARDGMRGNDGTVNGNSFSEGGLGFTTANVPLEDDVSGVLGGSASLSFHIKSGQVGSSNPWNSPGIFGRDHNGGTEDVFWGWINASGRLRLSAGNDAGITSPIAINDNQWRHVVLTRNSGTGQLQMFINGQLVVSGSARTGVLGGNWWNSFKTLGQIEGSGARFNGKLDDVRVYSRVLTAAEVADLAARPVVSLPPQTTDAQQDVGSSQAFTAYVRGGIGLQYSWNFGDGNSSAFSGSANTNYSYTKAGHYQVILTVRDSAGEESRYSFMRTVTHPLTAVQPRHTSTITGDAARIYSVNPDNDTVAALDAGTLAKLWEVPVGKEPRSLAVGPDGRVWVAVQAQDQLVVLNTNGTMHKTIRLEYGSGPYGVTFAPNGTRGLLSLENKSQLVSFDPATGSITGTAALDGDARGVAVSGDSSTAYVTRFRSTKDGGQLFKVNLATMSVTGVIALQVDATTTDAEDRARGIPNYLNQIVISPDGRRAWVPSKKDNILRGQYRDGQALEHDKMVRSIVSQIDMASAVEVPNEQIDFNDRAPARALVFSPRGDYAFVAQMESNMIEIVDAYSGSVRGGISNTGAAPQGLYLDASRQRLYVQNFLSRTVAAYDVSDTLRSVSFAPKRTGVTSTVAAEKLEASVLRGKLSFYNAADTRMSRDGYISCASCHADGDDDGMIWDFTDRGEGLRNTTSLRGRMGDGHGRVHWTANFDEIQDFENDIRNGFGGTGFMSHADFAATSAPLGMPKKGRSPALDDLAAYVSSLEDYPRSPARTENGKLSPLAAQGRAVFGNLNCASCHSGATFTDGLRHDVGTIQPSSGLGLSQPLAGLGFDTPTLNGVWKTAPYFHNGQAATLDEVLTSGHGGAGSLSNQDSVALVAYLKSLDGEKQYFQMKAAGANACWVARNLSNDGNINSYYCGSWNDQFWYEDILGRFHSKVNESYCAKGQPRNNGWFANYQCNNHADQRWIKDGDFLRSMADRNYVIDLYAASSEVGMWSFNGQNNQKWSKLPANFQHLRNGRFGCLTATGLSNNSKVVVETCRDDAMQRWWREGDRFHLMSDPSVCLDYKGQTFNNGSVVVWGCGSSENQRFVWNGTSLRTYRNQQFAVEAYDGAAGATVGIWSANGGNSQEWRLE
jgi:YVTN family beta-propeller protein